MYDYHSMFRAVEIRNEHGSIMLFDVVIVCGDFDGFKFGDRVCGAIVLEDENAVIIMGKDREYNYVLDKSSAKV